jgi:hypothetical protein
MAADGDDLYMVLGVPPDATPAQIAHAYRQLIRTLHPDTQSSAGSTSSDSTTLAAAGVPTATNTAHHPRRSPTAANPISALARFTGTPNEPSRKAPRWR